MPNKTATQKKSYTYLYGTKGKDKLTVSAKKHVEVFAYAGNDTITVTKGTGHKIYAGAGKDKITVKTGTSVDVYGDNSSYTTKGECDNDTITVNGGKNISVHGYGGNDVITVNDGTDWVKVGSFEYPDLGTVRVRVNLDEPMKIAAIGTIADCKLPNTFFFRQIASDFATTD